jgi:hypothetical protein
MAEPLQSEPACKLNISEDMKRLLSRRPVVLLRQTMSLPVSTNLTGAALELPGRPTYLTPIPPNPTSQHIGRYDIR